VRASPQLCPPYEWARLRPLPSSNEPSLPVQGRRIVHIYQGLEAEEQRLKRPGSAALPSLA